MLKKPFILTLSFLFCMACSSGPKDYLQESRELSKELLEEFKKVDSFKTAEKLSPKLQKLYRGFAALMMEAKEAEREGVDFGEEKAHEYNEALKHELQRLYKIDGVRDLIEKSQEEALHDLYLFDLKKKD